MGSVSYKYGDFECEFWIPEAKHFDIKDVTYYQIRDRGVPDYKVWCLGGKMHRLDGPAVMWEDGRVSYYIHGKLYPSKEEYEIGLNNYYHEHL